MMMFGFFELLLIAVLLAGNPGVPLGVPPADEDPLMYRLAPEECLYYVTWAGIATPDPNSANTTEQLFAQEEIQRAIQRIDQIATTTSQRMAESDEPMSMAAAKLAPSLIRAMLTHPSAFYIANLELGAEGLSADAGLVVDAGGQENAILEALNGLVAPELVEEYELQVETVEIGDLEFTKVAYQPAMPPILWGKRGRYVVVAIGEEAVQNLFARVETESPEWLTDLRQELPVDRTSSVAYLNLAQIWELSQPFQFAIPGELKTVVEELQLDNLGAYRCVTGLDKQGYVVHSQLLTSGPIAPLELLADLPLNERELQGIPVGSPAVIAAKLDLDRLIDQAVNVIAMFDAVDPQEAKADLSDGIEQTLGFSLDQLTSRILGDTIYVYASPTDGGLVSGWTAVVRLREPMLAQQSAERFFGFMSAVTRNEASVNLRSEIVGPYIVNSLEVEDDDLLVIPSWTVTSTELVISLFPQALKSHLARSDETDSITSIPEFAEALKQGDPMKNEGPKVMVQLDHGELIKLVYPIAQMSSGFWMSEFNEELELDLQLADFPSVQSLTQHTLPMRGVLSRTEGGYDWRATQTIPTGDLVTSAPMVAALALPAITTARITSRRTSSSNNLRQLALALHNYYSAFDAFPAAYTADEEGKPLLSWRVHILPFLGEVGLYEQFHLDEPWDSEHNKKLVEQMPDVFNVPGNDATSGLTNYLGVSGENKMFAQPRREEFGNPTAKGTQFQQIIDGTSNTAMIVEVNNENRVIWTQPDDFGAPGMQPLKRLIGLWKQGFQVAIADGSVRMISKEVDVDVLQNLFQINDGNVVELPFDR